MPEYRAYLLDKSGHISKAAIIIREETDEAAIAVTRALLDTRDLELWEEHRLVITLRCPADARGSSAKQRLADEGASEVG
jgi:hypothetical protein